MLNIYQWTAGEFSYTYLAKRALYKKLRQYRRFAKGKLLDIGCGSKPYCQLFSPGVKEYVGLDFKKTAGDRISHADVIGSALDLPFANNSFDTVLSTEVLEHIPLPGKMLKEIYRVLRPGGYIILTAPLFWPIHEKPFDYFRYTPYGLRYLLEESGLKIIKLDKTMGLFSTVGQLFSYGMYTEFGARQRFAVKAAILLLCFVIQRLALFLDLLYGSRGDSLDYLIVARR
jgi:SAM-dependent methyltransferase